MSIQKVGFGKDNVSRLIIGGNPFSGFSHLSLEKDKEMKKYYNFSNFRSTLDECIKNGINTLQARGDENIIGMIQRYQKGRNYVHWIAQTASEIQDIELNLNQIMENNPIAMYHHGTHTDNLWHTGVSGINKVKENLKRIRDKGVLTGLGTHKPEVIDYAENHGWDLDFYMASLYNLAKEYKHVQATDGFKEESFEDKDRELMFNMINSTDKKCLVFKVLGAGRKTDNLDILKNTFDYTFQNIKPSDCLVVGMYQKYKNQISENVKIIEELLND